MFKVVSYALLLLFLATDVRAQQTELSAASPVSYTIQARANGEPLAGLTFEQLAILEKLNRVNGPRLQRLAKVVVPATWVNDELAYSPFPRQYPWAANKAKAIVVDQPAQAFAAYEYGQLVRWGPVSSGGLGQTPSGLFALSWKSRGHHSSIDPSWYLEWYFNFIPRRGIAFHQYSMPGRAASHGCVRMLERDARWLFEWGEKGTAVVVLGCPDALKQWHDAGFLSQGISLPALPPTSTLECRGYSGGASTTTRRTIR